jgi:hypothetical protein
MNVDEVIGRLQEYRDKLGPVEVTIETKGAILDVKDVDYNKFTPSGVSEIVIITEEVEK